MVFYILSSCRRYVYKQLNSFRNARLIVLSSFPIDRFLAGILKKKPPIYRGLFVLWSSQSEVQRTVYWMPHRWLCSGSCNSSPHLKIIWKRQHPPGLNELSEKYPAVWLATSLCVLLYRQNLAQLKSLITLLIAVNLSGFLLKRNFIFLSGY